jgi:hypothetical protein
MRLVKVERGHRFFQRLLIGLLRVCFRVPVPDVVRATFYRPEFFGRPYNAWIQAVLRGDSEWTVGERELLAAFTSRLNRCPF